jgi:hypothetical protein
VRRRPSRTPRSRTPTGWRAIPTARTLPLMATPTPHPTSPVTPGPRARMRQHDWIDERSRALGQAVGQRLQSDPALLSAALERLGQWESAAKQRGDSHVLPALRTWRLLLESSSVLTIIALLGEASVRAARLRQSSPFVDVLSNDERAAIFRRFEEL